MKPRTRYLSVLLSLGIASCQSETAGPDPSALTGPSLQTAQDDVTPPTLTALSFAPTAINITSAPAMVTISFTVTDDLSGAVVICADFISPSTTQVRQGCTSFAAATSHSGTFDISFPQFVESGIWKLNVFTLQDAAGNGRSYPPPDLAAAGFPTDLDVTSVQDTTDPVLTALGFSPTAINTTGGPAVVTISFTVTDDLSGAVLICADFISPSTTQVRQGCTSFAAATSHSGTFDISFPQFVESGIWKLNVFTLQDAAGNGRSYPPPDLAAAGFPTDLQVNPIEPVMLFLHGSGGTANPPTLFLDAVAPVSTAAKYKDSPSVNFAGGNAWKEIGTWTAGPAVLSGTVASLGAARVWVGLKNSDDVGTRFDVRVEARKNGTLFAAGETLCVQNVVRNPNNAKEVTVGFAPFSPQSFNGTSDAVSLRILTRVGTNGSGGMCGGHSNAVGLRTYFDASTRAAGFEAIF